MKILVNFYANVTEQTVNTMITSIVQLLASQNPTDPNAIIDEIILQISSSWWSSDHGLLAYNFLKQQNIKKTTIGMGSVDSAAVMLYCAWDERIAMESCRFVLHEARANINWELSISKMVEMWKLLQRITDDYTKVVMKTIGKSNKQVKGKIAKGTVLSADESKKLGIVKTITNEPYIKEMKNLHIIHIVNPQPIVQQQPQPKAEV